MTNHHEGHYFSRISSRTYPPSWNTDFKKEFDVPLFPLCFFFLVVHDQDGEFAKDVKHWKKADLNGDNILDQNEFLAFHHPEHNRNTIEMMADDITPSYDHDSDGVS